MSEEQKAKFKLVKVTKLDELKEGIEIPESDLCIQTEEAIHQFEYVEEEEGEPEKYEIKPGIFTLVETNMGIITRKLELKNHNLLETVGNTQLIRRESKLFFDKLDIYKKYKKDARRAILLYSQPGMGKSSTISKISKEFVEEDKGTVVIFWDTSSISSASISKFLSIGSKFHEDCTRMLFIMEDIGGGNVENHYGSKGADASLLELLDGASVSFQLPTFIIATTNTPQNLLSSLADRPGRFDQMFELEPPSSQERKDIAKHVAGRELTEEEKKALESKGAKGLSIAHISEIVIRSELHDKSFAEVIREMVDHKERIRAAFEKAQKKVGLMGM